jgi:hypothetical protein
MHQVPAEDPIALQITHKSGVTIIAAHHARHGEEPHGVNSMLTSALSSSVIFIVPISAAKAEPDRPG